MAKPFELDGLCPLLQVFDMPTSIAFYRDKLGFEVIGSSGPGDDCDWCRLRCDGAELMLNTRYERDERPPEPDPQRVEAHDDTALFLGCRDLDALHAHLAAQGIAAEPPVTRPYGMRQVSCKDPDGYALCFQWKAEVEP